MLIARVIVEGQPAASFGVAITDRPKWSPGFPTVVRTTDGRFELRDLQPGTWSVVIQAMGTARQVVSNVQLVSGRTTDIGDVALRRGQRISGHVRDASGSPVAGATVLVGRDLGKRMTDPMERAFLGVYETTTDSSGAYVFEGIAGRHRFMSAIAARHPERGAALPIELPAGDAVVDFVLVTTGGDRRGDRRSDR